MATLIFTNRRMVNSMLVVLCCIHPWFTVDTLKQYELVLIYWNKIVPIIHKLINLYIWKNLILDHTYCRYIYIYIYIYAHLILMSLIMELQVIFNFFYIYFYS